MKIRVTILLVGWFTCQVAGCANFAPVKGVHVPEVAPPAVSFRDKDTKEPAKEAVLVQTEADTEPNDNVVASPYPPLPHHKTWPEAASLSHPDSSKSPKEAMGQATNPTEVSAGTGSSTPEQISASTNSVNQQGLAAKSPGTRNKTRIW